MLLVDIRMPVLDGVGATRRVREAAPETAVLVLTMYDDDATVFTAMQAGARGYLLKGADQDEIVGAIRAVAAGQAIFGPGIASRVLGYFAVAAGRGCAGGRAVPGADRPRARHPDLLADGRRTADIAAELFLSPKTVSNNLTTIFAKLEVADRGAAIIRAREHGLGGSR